MLVFVSIRPGDANSISNYPQVLQQLQPTNLFSIIDESLSNETIFKIDLFSEGRAKLSIIFSKFWKIKQIRKRRVHL